MYQFSCSYFYFSACDCEKYMCTPNVYMSIHLFVLKTQVYQPYKDTYSQLCKIYFETNFLSRFLICCQNSRLFPLNFRICICEACHTCCDKMSFPRLHASSYIKVPLSNVALPTWTHVADKHLTPRCSLGNCPDNTQVSGARLPA